MGDTESHPLDIPTFLKRDANNRAEFMMVESVEVDEVETEVEESRPAKSKPKAKATANGHAPIKAAGRPKAKAAGKAPVKAKSAPKATAKAAKAHEKAKVAKPRAEALPKDQFGFRKGSAKSDAAALYARKSGATLAEVKEKLGSVQLNVLVGLEAEGYKVDKKKEARGEGQRAVTRYRLFPK